MIRFSKRHHELKISYLKHRLKNLPHGYFGHKRGNTIVNIVYDPMDESVDNRNRRMLRIDSKEGRIIVPLVEEAMRLQRELDYLISEWNSMYWNEPRRIDYPLKRVRQPILNSEYFKRARSNMNTYKPEELKIEYEGQFFRTKNELAAALAVEQMGYEFKSEINVCMPGSTNDHYPDVSADIPELDLIRE